MPFKKQWFLAYARMTGRKLSDGMKAKDIAAKLLGNTRAAPPCADRLARAVLGKGA